MRNKFLKNAGLTSLLMCLSFSVMAGPREQAKNLYSSLTGNTANKAQTDKYSKLISEGKLEEAALDIVESDNGFYNVTLKNFFTPMSNEDGSQFAALNDMTATLIGATRDEIDFFRVFYDDIMYQFDGELITNSTEGIPEKYNKHKNTQDWLFLRDRGVAVPKYNPTKNKMYTEAEAGNVSLGDRKYFVQTNQLAYTTREPGAIAGIFSTRAWAQAYYEAGTNRASFAYFAKNFLCKEMEQLSDTTIPDDRVRRDVDRTPGGESSTYKTFCVGCHAGQDALGGAFVNYDFVDNKMRWNHHDTFNPQGDPIVVTSVAPKINAGNLYPDGRIVENDYWKNYWNEGQNAYIGWGSAIEGNGAKSLGKMLSETKEVRKCLSKKVFKATCYREYNPETDAEIIKNLAEKFDQTSNMKYLFINASIACMGE